VLGLALIIAGCGSGRSSTTKSTAKPGASTAGPSATPQRAAAQLAQLRDALPYVSSKLPSPTRSAKVESDYLKAMATDIQRLWRREFAVSRLVYQPARVVVFSGKVRSYCGEQSGPFYCPGDRTVYLDVRFFTELPANAGVGSAAQAYIVGHEFGHHVQQLIGIAGSVADANQADPRGKNARTVKVELQADCLAGVWGHSAYPRSGLTSQELNNALQTADVIGDDYIQRAAGASVDSSLWTHGSSRQRQYWLRTGYQTGRPSACDTFARP
jgi:predicted metalloprotease